MSVRTKIVTAAGASLLALGVAVGAVAVTDQVAFAQDATATESATPQSRASDFIARLAGVLGIGQDQLQSAITQTNLQMVDEAEAAGQLTAEQAQAARDRINSGDGGLFFGGMRGLHGHGHGHGPGFMKGASLDAAAAYLGISEDQLRQDLQENGSLQAVAAKYGQDTAEGKAGLAAAMADALRQGLADRGLTQEQIDQKVAEFTQNFDQLYTSTAPQGGPRGGWEPGLRQERSDATPTSTS